MKNVTITLKEEVARWARVYAARHDTSVSRLVGEILEKLMLEEGGYRRAKDQYLSATPMTLKEGGGYPRREDIHARKGLR